MAHISHVKLLYPDGSTMSSPGKILRIYLEINTLRASISEEQRGATECRGFRVLTVCTAKRYITARRFLRALGCAWGLFLAVLVKQLPAMAVHNGQTQSTGKTI